VVVWTCCNKQRVMCHTRVTNSPLPVAGQSSVCYHLRSSVYSTIHMPRTCVNSSDAFCYICGEVTLKSRRWSFTPLIKKCYEHYFGCKMGDWDKSCAPNFCCATCARILAAWTKGSHCMPFAIPMVWRQHMEYVSDCYSCLTSISVTAKSKHTVQYPNLPFVMRPVPHSAELRVPKPPTNMTLSESGSSDEDAGQANNNKDCDPTLAGACSSNEPHLLTQEYLNDIVHDLNLSKKQAELLGSRLKGIFCARKLRCAFTLGTMKNSRIYAFNIRNTHNLIQYLNNTPMLPQYTLASLDITNLYANIPVSETKIILTNMLEHQLIDPQSQQEILRWYDVITKQNYFSHKRTASQWVPHPQD